MILAIDATNWVHQLWHTQKPDNVLPLALRRLEILVDFARPQHVVACFDTRSFRHDLLPDYKAHRGQKATTLVDALHAAPAIFHRLALVCRIDGFEADDCLATLATLGIQGGQQVVIASPDKDVRQCLRVGAVSQLRNFKTSGGRLTDPDWCTANTLYNATGLQPEQWVDYQTLLGDSSDNVAGCPGWGEKTAQAALIKCKSLDSCMGNLWAVPCSNKQRDALRAWKDLELTRRLVTLVTDVPGVMDCLR